MTHKLTSAGSVDAVTTPLYGRFLQALQHLLRSQDFLYATALIVLGCLIYLPQATTLTVRGEESRRARIAWEMLHDGDWVVPRIQGEPRLTRPPFHYWSIATVGWLRGDVDVWAMRIPSFIATISTALLVFWVLRREVSPAAAFISGLAMLTMGQVIQLARLGESDATFMALLSGALLVWYSGRERGWSPYLYQSLAYLLLTAATLTKGPQAPVYFAGAVGLYLIYHKKWRELFHPAHFVGIAIYLGLISFWHYLFILQYSLKDLYVAYFGEVEKRMTDFTWLQYMGHLILYPLEIMAACLAPWSILFCAQCNRQFRQFFQSQHYSVSFMLIAIGVAWPTVWLPAASNTRYFLPLLPCVAILLGYHIETLLKGWTESQLTGASVLRQIWLRFSWTMLAMMVVSGLGLTVISFFPSKSLPAENGAVLALLALVTLLLVFVTLSIREGKFQQRAAYLPVQVSLMVLFIAVIVNGPVTSFMSFRSNNAVPHIAAVRAMIPTTETLISFDLTHHLFTYFWKDDLPRMPWPETKAHIPAGQKYFCFLNSGSRPYPPIPCAWQEIATVNCDRNLKNVAYDVVVVGKFLMPSEVEAIQAQADASIIATLHLPVEEIATSSIPPTKTPVGRNEPAGILK